jgi:putative nucleotidyltransferase with HDIG domain
VRRLSSRETPLRPKSIDAGTCPRAPNVASKPKQHASDEMETSNSAPRYRRYRRCHPVVTDGHVRDEQLTHDEGAITLPVQGRRSRWLVPYVVAVDVVGLAVVLFTFPGLPQRSWPTLLLIIALSALAESWTVPISRHGEVSLCFIANFAAATLFGPCFGALAACGGSLFADAVVRRRGVTKTAFNAGQFAVVGGLTGLAFDVFRAGPSLSLTSNAIAYAVAAIVFVIVNSGLAAGAIALQGQPFVRLWLSSLREGGIFYLAMAPLGALMASAYSQSPWALLYFPLLVWGIYKGFGLFAKLRSETREALVVLANTIDKRDPYTYQHSVRVAQYVTQIATGLGLPAEEIDLVVSAAHVHDLGKISIDNRILFKEGRLTDEERQQINTHSAAGAELAGQFSMYGAGADIIRHHHERWDGSGYPDGLAGEAIPPGARIIAVADVYDAMTSDRPYRRALSHEIAISELMLGSGTQFDAKVVDAFLALGSGPVRATTPAPEAVLAHT